MSLFSPNDPQLKSNLSPAERLLVVCYCAAWCDTCNEYRPKLESLAKSRPDHVFVWVDIEDDPDVLGDNDVENFPTILLERNGESLFFGEMLPHIGQLERLIDVIQEAGNIGANVDAPEDVRSTLLQYER